MDLIDAGGRALSYLGRLSAGVGTVVSDPAVEARLDRIPTRLGPYGVDPFGLDPAYLRRFVGAGAWLYRHYFRCEVFGIEHIPDGRALLVANHSGQLPYDAAMIAMAVLLEREPPRVVRAMVERSVPATPFISTFFARCGHILGTPDNCRRLLQNEDLLQVFPEGVAGLNKTWRHRYQLQRLGQGFARLAIEARAPIVPVAVIGAEEQAPSVANLPTLGQAVGLPALPLTLTPLFGLLPLPTRYRIYFGSPMMLDGDANDEHEAIARQVGRVRGRLQAMVDAGLAARRSVFW